MATRTENRVYLEGLIQEFQREGFRAGLIVERDGYTQHIWFDGGVNGYCAFPLKPTLQKEAENDADRIRQTHIAYMNREDATHD